MRTNLTNDEIIKLPLDKILLENGYKNEREKSSKNSIKLKNNNGDSIIITRNEKEHYLFWNVKDDRDKGNIFNFCKNRNIKIFDLLEKKELNLKNITHNIIPNNLKKETIETIEKFKELNPLNTQDNFFYKDRMILQKILKIFENQIKQDKLKNICVPTYSLNTFKNKKYYSQVGYISYLKNPITKSKNGELYKKPIKQLCYGNKGLEILKSIEKENSRKEDIQKIIITESTIDSLSLFYLLKNEDIKENFLLCATNGIVTETHLKIFENFNKDFKKSKIILGFDNDFIGEKNTEKTLNCFSNLEIEIYKPLTKDFNEDLQTFNIFGTADINELSKIVKNIYDDFQTYIKSKPYIYNHLKESEFNKALINAKKLEWSYKKLKNLIPSELHSKINESIKDFNKILKGVENEKVFTK